MECLNDLLSYAPVQIKLEAVWIVFVFRHMLNLTALPTMIKLSYVRADDGAECGQAGSGDGRPVARHGVCN